MWCAYVQKSLMINFINIHSYNKWFQLTTIFLRLLRKRKNCQHTVIDGSDEV